MASKKKRRPQSDASSARSNNQKYYIEFKGFSQPQIDWKIPSDAENCEAVHKRTVTVRNEYNIAYS